MARQGLVDLGCLKTMSGSDVGAADPGALGAAGTEVGGGGGGADAVVAGVAVFSACGIGAAS
jgi:hypothetical protein